MREEEVGISLFMSDNIPIEATIKHRMTDFLVEEISIQGKIEKFDNEYLKGFLKRARRYSERNSAEKNMYS